MTFRPYAFLTICVLFLAACSTAPPPPREPLDLSNLPPNDIIADQFVAAALGKSAGLIDEGVYRVEAGSVYIVIGAADAVKAQAPQAMNRLKSAFDIATAQVEAHSGITFKYKKKNQKHSKEMNHVWIAALNLNAQDALSEYLQSREEFTKKAPKEFIYHIEEMIKFYSDKNINHDITCYFTKNSILENKTILIFNSYLSSFSEETLNSCIYFNIFYSLGLLNIFEDYEAESRNIQPTNLHWLMLEMLYDERVQSGMDAFTLYKTARQILRDWRPEGERPQYHLWLILTVPSP